jgi:hypothetical protein
MSRSYAYVGPERIREAARSEPPGLRLDGPEAVQRFLATNPDARITGATFTVDLDGWLLVAPRRSEHVACASGARVLAAGEMIFSEGRVVSVTNQSTGYCPDPACWPAMAEALARAGLPAPDGWTTAFVFRVCTCGQVNLVKDGWFVCAVCGAGLPENP